MTVYTGVRETLSTGANTKAGKRRTKSNNRTHSRNSDRGSSGSNGRAGGACVTDSGQHDEVGDQIERAQEFDPVGGTRAGDEEEQDVVSASAGGDGKVALPGGRADEASPPKDGSNGGVASTDGAVAGGGDDVTSRVEANGSRPGHEERGGDVGQDPFELLSPDKLASFDIVLTTFDVLRAEVHHAQSRFAGSNGGASDGSGTGSRPSLRQTKRYCYAVLSVERSGFSSGLSRCFCLQSISWIPPERLK